MSEKTYTKIKNGTRELEHNYGDQVRILSSPYTLSLLEKVSSPDCVQPLFTHYVKELYNVMFHWFADEFLEVREVQSETRMKEFCDEGIYIGNAITSENKITCVDLARAGMIPSQLFYEMSNYLVDPKNVRQDHFYAARKTNEKGEVIGVDISGSKIGGDINNSHVLLPDPMGATGSTICHAIDHYKKNVEGKARGYFIFHLIITPEAIVNIKKNHPDAYIIACRLDRGLSTQKALESVPGTYVNEERGLNDIQYIVPGAGGVGELLNNSFV